MLTREELIKYYDGQLKKVKIEYRTDTWSDLYNDRNSDCVTFWENELEAVKNGREW